MKNIISSNLEKMFVLKVFCLLLLCYNGVYGDANAEAESDNVNHFANSLPNARKGEDHIMDAIKTIKTVSGYKKIII